jgi:flagella basal body P-ring formation protein FlgA
MSAIRLLVAAALALVATPAFAGQLVNLRPDTVSAGAFVTLGDLFDDAGQAAGVAVVRRTGATVVLNARAVQIAAARAGLDWTNPDGLSTIVVQGGSPAADGAGRPARGNVEVLTYGRSLLAGEIIQPADLVWSKVALAPADAPSDADLVVGLAARRPLRAGAAVSVRDLGAAQVIKAGETITVTFDADGIVLALQAKAMSAAGVGELLNVQNIDSKKVIQAVVSGPGQAVVGPAANTLKAAGPSRYALR